jgi:hypothetical protein
VAVLGLEAPRQLVVPANTRLGVQAGDQVHWLWRHHFSTIFMHQKGGFIMPKIAKNLIAITTKKNIEKLGKIILFFDFSNTNGLFS